MSFAEDIMIQGKRSYVDIDNIPDSDTREDDLAEVLDLADHFKFLVPVREKSNVS